MRIYLVGYMYSGKTTLGRALAKRMGYNFIDTDQLFEERYHTHITLFFQKYGEAAFRILERQVLHSTAQLDHTVVATGGGTPCHGDNMEWINRNGCSIYLQMSEDALLERQANSHKQRPIFAGMSKPEQHRHLIDQLRQRIPYYRLAHITVDGTNPNLELIVQAIGDRQDESCL